MDFLKIKPIKHIKLTLKYLLVNTIYKTLKQLDIILDSNLIHYLTVYKSFRGVPNLYLGWQARYKLGTS